ncbi:hypothetical protein PIB30_080568 [Stylosanthes scabra]|uniref:Putative plant transposon protein domain-containing protein n=1 Tax=Stylosanthes scabra TaxID=79078 RepID=A0ABU6XPI0_9FABA|nr:hypothetical protein [Stylosanthes scabra]
MLQSHLLNQASYTLTHASLPSSSHVWRGKDAIIPSTTSSPPSPCHQSHAQASSIHALTFAPLTHVTFGVPSPNVTQPNIPHQRDLIPPTQANVHISIPTSRPHPSSFLMLLVKSPFHEHFFNSNVASKPIIPDTRFNLEEDQYPQIQQQIELRGWKRLNKPKKRVSQTIIREFYANARIDPDNEVGPLFHTFVRGMLVNSRMDRIKTIMKCEGPLNSETSYGARMVEGNQDLDEVTRDICVEGAIWSLGARNNPLYLKRSDLNPVARGWHEFIIHDIMLTTNQSEVTLNRAVLIHCIMSSQEVRVEKIIVDAMMNIISKLHTSKPPLAFPNIIARLCEEMEISFLASGPVEAMPKARSITPAVMENIRHPLVQPFNHQQHFHHEQPIDGYGWGQL